MSVTVDQEKCIGCQMCVGICGEIFEIDPKTGKAFVKENSPEKIQENEDCIQDAINSCPVGAISKEEE